MFKFTLILKFDTFYYKPYDNLHMTPHIHALKGATLQDKMAAFDFDWTLVQPKDGKTFPTSIDDWQWLYPSIPEYIRGIHNEGYMIVIFTNQTKSWKNDQILQVAEQLDIPLFIAIATDKPDQKPNTILFDTLLGDNSINKQESFFVGDALGRPSDFSDSDKVFAERIDVSCFSPEEFFDTGSKEFSIPTILPAEHSEIIIMMGFPGSGKSTIAKQLCQHTAYIYIEGDLYKTSSKMIKTAVPHIALGKSVVFDATHSSKKKRQEYVELSKKHAYSCRCIHVATSLEESYRRNKLRDHPVPKIAYSVYSKHYEAPCEEEGFALLTI